MNVLQEIWVLVISALVTTNWIIKYTTLTLRTKIKEIKKENILFGKPPI